MMENIGTGLIDRTPQVGNRISHPRSRLHQASWSANVRARREARLLAERAVPETRITIRSNKDIVEARQSGSVLVRKMGFSSSRVTLVTTVISELARNILLYAKDGEIVLSELDDGSQLNVKAFDRGPGIENLPEVLSGGFSTSGGLGLGLSGLRHIVDEFDIKSQPGKGTRVSVRIHA